MNIHVHKCMYVKKDTYSKTVFAYTHSKDWFYNKSGPMFWLLNSKLLLGVSENNGTPKSSMLIGFSIINHPFWGTSIFGNTLLVPQP